MKSKYYLRGLGTGIVVSAILMAMVSGGNKSMSDEEVRARALQLGMVVADNTLAGNAKQSDGVVGEGTGASQEKETQESAESESREIAESGSGVTEDQEKETQETIVSGTHENDGAGDQGGQLQETAGAGSREGQVQETDGAGDQGGQLQETAEAGSQEGQVQETVEAGNAETKEPGSRENEIQQTEESAENNTQQTGESGVVSITVYRGYSSYPVAKLLAEAGLVESATGYDAYLCANGYDKRISVGTFEISVGSSEEEIAKLITGQKH